MFFLRFFFRKCSAHFAEKKKLYSKKMTSSSSYERAVDIFFTSNEVWGYTGAIGFVVLFLVGGVLVWLVLMRFLHYIMFPSERAPNYRLKYVDKEEKKRYWTVPGCENWFENFRHQIYQILFFGGIVYLIFLGFGSIGMNPMQSGAMTLVVGAIVAAFFSSSFSQIGSNSAMRWEGLKLNVGKHLNFGAQMPGVGDLFIKSIHNMTVICYRFDEQKQRLVDFYLPMSHLHSMYFESDPYLQEHHRTFELWYNKWKNPPSDAAVARFRRNAAIAPLPPSPNNDEEAELARRVKEATVVHAAPAASQYDEYDYDDLF